MFLSFKKKLSNHEGNRFPKSKLAEGFSRRCNQLQKQMASYLQKKTELLSCGVKKVYLIIFCLLASSISVNVIINSWRDRKAIHTSVVEIRFPIHVNPKQNKMSGNQPLVNDPAYQRVKMFASYMDSLTRTASGKIIHDSILAVRPGLMDSIAELETTPFK